jgi:hypothetical protein
VTYFIPYRSWYVIYLDSAFHCPVSFHCHFYSPAFFTSCSCLYLMSFLSSFQFISCFLPLIFPSFLHVLFNPRHCINSIRSLKQARVEWEWILKLNWITSLLYPTNPWRKGDSESAQQTSTGDLRHYASEWLRFEGEGTVEVVNVLSGLWRRV